MDIILAKDYTTLGFTGDTVSVKRGFARNFLIPRGIAVEASSRNKSQLKHKIDGIMAVKRRLQAEALKRLEEMQKLEIKLVIKLGEGGKTFGSVGTRDIEQALKAQGVDISRKQITLPEPIKSVGDFVVMVKLHSEVNGELKISVVADKALGGAARKKGRGKKGKAAEGDQSTEQTEDGLEDKSSEDSDTEVVQ